MTILVFSSFKLALLLSGGSGLSSSSSSITSTGFKTIVEVICSNASTRLSILSDTLDMIPFVVAPNF